MTHHAQSSLVHSTQTTVHMRLAEQVQRHLESDWQSPLHQPTVAAFEALAGCAFDPGEKIVLDSGCGTGESTRRIAACYPDCLVIGIDQSAARLARITASDFPHREGNAFWLRAELSSFWRLALAAGWKLHRHFLLYPNPWPKPGHLKRRWHAHPVFPGLLSLGGQLEMRCNWDLYALEFALAVKIATGFDPGVRPTEQSAITSPFEQKYRASGHPLFTVGVPEGANLMATRWPQFRVE